MALLIILIFCLLPHSAQAQSVEAPLFAHSARIYIVYPMPDVVYFHDEHGNSVIFYRQWSGLAWYSARDSSGRIVREGYGIAPPLALNPSSVPSLNRETSDEDVR
ncbi:MAG TPA: hypothetical protein VLL06_02185 [Nitrospiraceae bacterium]|nr:hypothetical protein [Nitrospiraceae bacterium]